VATAQNCCDSESPACSPTHSPAAPGRPSARPGQTLSRPPLGGQPQGLELPVTVARCRHSGPTVTVTAAPALAPGLHSVTPSQWPPRHRVTVRLAAGVTGSGCGPGLTGRLAARRRPGGTTPRRRVPAAARRTMRCLQAKCTTILRCSGRKLEGDLVYVQSESGRFGRANLNLGTLFQVSSGANQSQSSRSRLWPRKRRSGDKGGRAAHCKRCYLWGEEHAVAWIIR